MTNTHTKVFDRADPAGRVVVIGGGTMGSGIAQSLAAVGYPVSIIETNPAEALAALDRVHAGLQRGFRRNPSADRLVQTALDHVSASDRYEPEPAPLLVIEAVAELIELKRTVIGRARDVWPDAVIATNTSSFALQELSGGLPRPDLLVGMHFFNPVPKSQLVELSVDDHTAPAAVEVAHALVSDLGKTAIQVRSVTGLATSRLGIILGMEAIRMVEENVASAHDIDTGMRLGYRHPLGPLEVTDLVGLDVRLAIAEHLTSSLGPRFEPPELLRRHVERGQLGAKTGQGFYRWENGRRVDKDDFVAGDEAPAAT